MLTCVIWLAYVASCWCIYVGSVQEQCLSSTVMAYGVICRQLKMKSVASYSAIATPSVNCATVVKLEINDVCYCWYYSCCKTSMLLVDNPYLRVHFKLWLIQTPWVRTSDPRTQPKDTLVHQWAWGHAWMNTTRMTRIVAHCACQGCG